jgi:peptide/nickel transport system substrate-binding protein
VDIGEWDCHPTDNPEGPLRLFIGYPLTGRTDVFFVFDIEDDGGNPYLGSGQLDGNGIPPDFFSDVHIRKAFNYCFDWETYIQDALAGEAVQNYGPINIGNLGYDPDGLHYSYDPAKCEEELKLAWDGQVWENGFRFQTVYNTGNVTRQTIAKIMQQEFSDINPKFQIELVGLPWPSFLNAVIASRVPMFLSGWGEDYHDPHNWVQPMLVGTNAVNQRLPAEILQEFRELITAAVTAPTPEARAEIYYQINQLDFEYAPAIRLAVATGRHYQQRWVQDWFRNPIRQWFFDVFTKQ